jgi:hypothetical protein
MRLSPPSRSSQYRCDPEQLGRHRRPLPVPRRAPRRLAGKRALGPPGSPPQERRARSASRDHLRDEWSACRTIPAPIGPSPLAERSTGTGALARQRTVGPRRALRPCGSMSRPRTGFGDGIDAGAQGEHLGREPRCSERDGPMRDGPLRRGPDRQGPNARGQRCGPCAVAGAPWARTTLGASAVAAWQPVLWRVGATLEHAARSLPGDPRDPGASA